MVEEISDFYKEKGFNRLYVNINKEPRRVATLRTPEGKMTSMSYAKYLYTSYHKCDIPKGEQIDHINSDKMDDRIENLQKVSWDFNNKKDKKDSDMIEMECPVCKNKFLFLKRNLPTHPNPCCSRKCGGIKSHWSNR